MSMPPLSPLGFEPSYSSAYCFDGVLYLVGGGLENDNAMAYDLETRSWSVLPSMPQSRFEAHSVTLDGKIYVFGGCDHDDNDRFRSVISFDPETNAWSDDYPELPLGMEDVEDNLPWGFGMAVVAHEGRLVVFGLAGSPPLVLENGAWEPLPDVFPRQLGESVMFPCLASLRLL